MENKYYTPDISELYVGFECEHTSNMSAFEYNTIDRIYKENLNETDLSNYLIWSLEEDGLEKFIRVKYLDKEDIESLGFTNKNHKEIPSKFCYYKVINDNTIYKIQVYWHMLTDIRENLIRIYKGKSHQYPYEEIFRGDIKNKSELKKLLKQLNILDE